MTCIRDLPSSHESPPQTMSSQSGPARLRDEHPSTAGWMAQNAKSPSICLYSTYAKSMLQFSVNYTSTCIYSLLDGWPQLTSPLFYLVLRLSGLLSWKAR